MSDSGGHSNDPAQRRCRRRPSAAVLALAVLVPVVPILVGVLILAGGGGASSAPAGTHQSFTPISPGTSTPALSTSAPLTPPGSGALAALVTRSTVLLANPHGRLIHRVSTHTEFGSPETLLVVDRAPGWLGVVSPLAGNGRVGWIPATAASLGRVPWEVKVSLSARRLTVLDAGKVVQRYTVAIGRPDAPTPTGRFAVTDRLATGDPSGPYGCCILALSATSPHAIQGWTGGNRIAIHSTPDTSSIGQAVSHGCVRLTLAEGRWLMSHVPLGTPTLISS